MTFNIVGPIAEGETPQNAADRIARTFNVTMLSFTHTLHAPLKGTNQQFPVLIGTIRGRAEEKS